MEKVEKVHMVERDVADVLRDIDFLGPLHLWVF
jgi:hypothetical protein